MDTTPSQACVDMLVLAHPSDPAAHRALSEFEIWLARNTLEADTTGARCLVQAGPESYPGHRGTVLNLLPEDEDLAQFVSSLVEGPLMFKQCPPLVIALAQRGPQPSLSAWSVAPNGQRSQVLAPSPCHDSANLLEQAMIASGVPEFRALASAGALMSTTPSPSRTHNHRRI